MIRIPGVCNHNWETTVLCHLNGGGAGMKHPDYLGAFGCSACHDVVDGRRQVDASRDLVMLWHYQGIARTQRWWVENGYLVVTD